MIKAKEALYCMSQMADKCLISLSAIQKDYNEFVSLVKRMREAQNRVDMLADGEDIEFVDMLCIEQREAEREVDEYLKKMDV